MTYEPNIGPLCEHTWSLMDDVLSETVECHRDATGRYEIRVDGEAVATKDLCDGHGLMYTELTDEAHVVQIA